jgi:HD-GYP domain-containing protein (c-di-GMP phosphodiesterase class II)
MNYLANQKNVGGQILLITSVLMTSGTIIGGVCWGFLKNEFTFSLFLGFTASMVFHWSFYFLYKKSLLPKRQSDHLIALFSCLLFFFIAFYNPFFYSDIWVVLLYYPLILGILASEEVFKVWVSIFLVLFHLYYFIEPSIMNEQAQQTFLLILGRSLFSFFSCAAGLIILTYLHNMNKNNETMVNEKNKRYIFQVLYTLTPIVERKSHTTRNEIEEFRCLMKSLAKYFPHEKITDWEIDLVSLLHYVSRINWPDYMFEKKDTLTQFEYEIIQEHCFMGAELINGFSDLEHIKMAFLHHHERLDGTGYPEQLSGSQISFFSQLIAVTESYIALTTSRSYRQALSKHEAYYEIYKMKGQAYREDIVKVLAEALEIEYSDSTSKKLVG